MVVSRRFSTSDGHRRTKFSWRVPRRLDSQGAGSPEAHTQMQGVTWMRRPASSCNAQAIEPSFGYNYRGRTNLGGMRLAMSGVSGVD